MPGVVGPFHSLSESDRRSLVAMVGSGRSVRSAAGELGVSGHEKLTGGGHEKVRLWPCEVTLV